jgi:hypothetical protein
MPHQFAAGQTVEYFAADGRFGGAGLYTIIRLLPEDAGDYQYHIQRTGGGEQRCVREAQLRSAGPRFRQRRSNQTVLGTSADCPGESADRGAPRIA